MKTCLLTVLGLALAVGASAQNIADQSFSSSAAGSRQSSDEVEDIGFIVEKTVVERVDPGGKSIVGKDFIPQEKAYKFRFTVSSRPQYSSNAEMSGDHGSDDFLWQPQVEGGVRVELPRGFGLDLAGKVETVLYASFDERSFVGYSAQATLDYRPAPALPRVFISAEPYRFDRYDDGDLITQAVGLTAGTDWGVGFNNGNSLAFVGYQFTKYLSDPGIDDRNSHRATLGLTHIIAPKLVGQLFYAYQYSGFDIDRQDSRHLAGVNLTYQFSRNWFASLSGTFVDLDSTQERASYQGALAAFEVRVQF